MKKRIFISMMTTLFLAVTLSGCFYAGAFNRARLVNTRELKPARDGSIEISYLSENITFLEGSGETLLLKEYMSTDREAYHAQIKDDDGHISIQTGERPYFGMFSSYVEIYLPASFSGTLSVSSISGDIVLNQKSTLAQLSLSSASGAISVSDISAQTIALSTVSGRIDAQRMAATQDYLLESTSGRLEARDVSAGFLGARTVSGQIELSGVSGTMEVKSTSGRVDVEAEEGGGTFSTISGRVALDFAAVAGDIRAETASAGIALTLPRALAFRFQAASSTGGVQTDFDDALSIVAGKNASGTVGGDAEIDIVLESFSGSISARYP